MYLYAITIMSIINVNIMSIMSTIKYATDALVDGACGISSMTWIRAAGQSMAGPGSVRCTEIIDPIGD